jgi:hypothetical protein
VIAVALYFGPEISRFHSHLAAYVWPFLKIKMTVKGFFEIYRLTLWHYTTKTPTKPTYSIKAFLQ